MTRTTFVRALPLILALVVTGCASVSFKRGASGEAMAEEERACRQQAGTASHEECMRAHGQVVRGRDQAAATPVQPVATPLAVPGRPSGTLPVASPTARPTVSPAAGVPSGGTEGSDPLTRVSVSSWWKLGAKPDELDAAMGACLTELGEAHRPDPGAKVVTAGLIECLRRAGWYPLGQGGTR